MVKSMVYANWRYPIALLPQHSIIFDGVDLYLSPELYAKNKSFMRDFKENGQVKVTSDMLQLFQRQLNDQSYNVSKIYAFKNLSVSSKVIMKEDDFVLPDFNIHVKLKDQSSKESVKKRLEFSYSILESDKKVRRLAPSNHDDLSGQAEYIKNLSKKVNLKSLTHVYENFFLYDLQNIIKVTFATEIQKEFSIYGLISFSGETKKNNKLDLIKPADNLKFELIEDVYKNSLGFELGKVHTKKSFNVVSDKVFNFAILRTEKNKRTGEKRTMNLEIIDTIRILGIQDNDVNFLTPITISISSDTVMQKLTKYKKHRYRFLLESLLFSSNVENNTDVILISCTGLSDAKQALINSKLTSLLGMCYLNELKDWELVKGQPKRPQAIFTDSEKIRNSFHFAFAFTTRHISDLLNFTVILLDGDGKEIKFPAKEKKLPIINFQIQIVKNGE